MNRPSKGVARCAALVTLVGVAVVAGAQPASATYSDLSATTWAYTDSHDPKKAFVKLASDAPLGTRTDAAHQKHTSRFYFTIDLSSLQGKVLHYGFLLGSESSVADCASVGHVELWRTGPVTSKTTWNNPPAQIERLSTTQPNRSYRCPGYVGDDVMTAVTAALARHESSITFGFRLAAGDEQNTAYATTLHNRPVLTVSANAPPTVSGLGATMNIDSGRCGTPWKPVRANGNITLSATLADPDSSGYLQGDFALWPASDPAQRTEFGGSVYYPDNLRSDAYLYPYAEGTLLAFAARAYDQEDYSAWTKPCYLLIDRTPPSAAPKVSSSTFVESQFVASGGEGVPGDFRFSAEGDHSVVSFRYSVNTDGYSQIVPAQHAGGRARISYTPRFGGPKTLTVVSLDEAGNASPAAEFHFWVADTAPDVSIDVAGVGLPSTIRMSSAVAGLSGFSYQIESGPVVKFPAVGGTGTAPLTFDHVGTTAVTARTYADGKVVGQTVYQAQVTDAPDVSSEEFKWPNDSVVGDHGSFTFKPGRTGVVAYRYSFNSGADWQQIAAQADGTAVLDWTADAPGYRFMYVQSVQADGSQSQPATYQFNVIDPRPAIWTDESQSFPRRDGVGRPVEVQLSSYMPNVTGFVYTFNGGPEQTVTGGSFLFTTVTPVHPGEQTIVAQAVYADGTRSPANTHTFTITNAPLVSWNGDTLMPGDTATFTAQPALSGVTSYKYVVDSYYPQDATQTVTAAADGTATVPWVINFPGYHVIQIASVSSDGTVSDFRIFDFIVSDPTVGVYGYYTDFMTRGGIGVPGPMSFYSGMAGQVAGFVFQVNGGPEQSVAMPPQSTSAWTTITPDRNGTNVLTVKSLMTDGRYSPITTYQFLVGTAPFAVSPQYPDNNWGGGAGVAGDFTFSGGTAGIVAFVYQFNGGTQAEAPTDATGAATVQWTPDTPGYNSLVVQGKLADGTLTDTTGYTVYVNYA